MKARSQKRTARKKRRWLRRFFWVVSTVLLIVVVATGFVLGNLKRIVLRQLRASFPGVRVSVAGVSLKSLSRLHIIGLELSGARGQKGTFVMVPKVDARFRLHPLRGLILKRVDLRGLTATIRSLPSAVMPTLARNERKKPRAETFPAGPSIGKVSLTNSRLDMSLPNFRLTCFVDAIADSSSTGTLLNDTDLSLRLRNVSLKLPSFQMGDVDSELSAVIVREPTGKRIDILQGVFLMPDVLRYDFHGGLSFEGSSLAANWQMELQAFQLTDIVTRLNESFPGLDEYRMEGQGTAALRLHYSSDGREPFSLSGDISLRRGRAVLPVAKPLIAEGVEADLPLRYTYLDGKATIATGSDERHLAGATIAAARISRDDQELASDLVASFELQPRPAGGHALKSGNASFRSHGGNVNARLHGDLRGNTVYLKGDLDLQDIELDRACRSFRLNFKDSLPELDRYEVKGKADGSLQLRYLSERQEELFVSGKVSLKPVDAILSLPKPLVMEGLSADLPFQCSILDGSTVVLVGSDGHKETGATVAVAQITYDGQPVASDLLASLEPEDEPLKSPVTGAESTPPEIDKQSEPTGKQGAFSLAAARCRAFFRCHGGKVGARLAGSVRDSIVEVQGDLDVEKLDLEKAFRDLATNLKESTPELSGCQVEGETSGHLQFRYSSGKEGELLVSGNMSLKRGRASFPLPGPLRFSGLEIDTPFEYTLAPNVQILAIKASQSYPSGGRIAAVRVTYGEGSTEGEASAPRWMVSSLSATAVTEEETLNFRINSGRAYDGEITGTIMASVAERVIGYGGNLRVQKLDLGRFARALGAKEEKLEITGQAEGELAFSGKGGKWDRITGRFSSPAPGGRFRVEGKKDFVYKAASADIDYPSPELRVGEGAGLEIKLRLQGTGTGEAVEKMLDSLHAGTAVLEGLKKTYSPEQWKMLARDWEIEVTIPITFKKAPPVTVPAP